jgi:hypothetical protein
MRRAKLEGRQIGRTPLQVDRVALLRDRENGKSIGDLVITGSRKPVSAVY